MLPLNYLAVFIYLPASDKNCFGKVETVGQRIRTPTPLFVLFLRETCKNCDYFPKEMLHFCVNEGIGVASLFAHIICLQSYYWFSLFSQEGSLVVWQELVYQNYGQRQNF